MRPPTFKAVWNYVQRTEEWAEWRDELGLRGAYRATHRRCSEVLDELPRLAGQDCWRVLLLSEGVDPTTLSPLGVHWTEDREIALGFAQEHLRDRSIVAQYPLYRAQADAGLLDVRETVYARCTPFFGEEEEEITFRPSARIYVYTVELDGETFPIADYRRC